MLGLFRVNSPNTRECPSRHHVANILSTGLESTTDTKDNRAGKNCHFATKFVANVASGAGTEESTSSENLGSSISINARLHIRSSILNGAYRDNSATSHSVRIMLI